MANAAPRLTVAQFDLLRWVAGGGKDGVYEGTSHRVSAPSLHNRGLVRVTGKSATWNASITPEGTRMLEETLPRIAESVGGGVDAAGTPAERVRSYVDLLIEWARVHGSCSGWPMV